MIRHFAKLGAACALVLTSLVAQSAPAQAPAVETFFQDSLMAGAKLSPNGKLVALKMRTKDSRMQLAVLDLETMKVNSAAAIAESDVRNFNWVNDHRLVFDLEDRRVGVGDFDAAPGLYAVDVDGSKFRPLVERVRHFVNDGQNLKLLPQHTYYLREFGNQDSEDIYVWQPAWVEEKALENATLLRLNTVNGHVKEIEVPTHSQAFLFDQSGVLQFVETREVNLLAIRQRNSGTGAWVKLVEDDMLSPDLIELAHLDSAGHLFVTARNGSDTSAVYLYDPDKRKLADKPFLKSDRYDLDRVTFIERDGKLLGARYTVDAEVTQWFDAEYDNVQKIIDKALPGTVNRISVAKRPETKFVLIEAYGDKSPAVFYVFNTEQKKLFKLGAANPDIDKKSSAATDFIHYKTRDGIDIPAYLTLPRDGKKNLPLVVLVHGGPWARDGWAWDPKVQFLASRGYAVLQPQFRSSTGLGRKLFDAGMKQWGMAMQDDLADGAQWAISQGVADPKRICIAGAAYGGYAALMGVIKNPELFRCAFEWAGVTDIDLMFSVKWSDLPGIWKEYGMNRLIGDPVKDAEQFKATSPIQNAAKIRAPLLLAYGGMDERVPIIHGKKFRDAVKATNPNVEWVEYAQEGHGWRALETNVDFWTRVERFLDANIGKH